MLPTHPCTHPAPQYFSPAPLRVPSHLSVSGPPTQLASPGQCHRITTLNQGQNEAQSPWGGTRGCHSLFFFLLSLTPTNLLLFHGRCLQFPQQVALLEDLWPHCMIILSAGIAFPHLRSPRCFLGAQWGEERPWSFNLVVQHLCPEVQLWWLLALEANSDKRASQECSHLAFPKPMCASRTTLSSTNAMGHMWLSST